jgi:hypothetical protein
MKNLLICVGIALLPFLSLAQDTTNKDLKVLLKRSVFFNSPDPMEITLVSDFKRIKSKRLKKVYQPATATVAMPGVTPVTEEVELAARGEFRRTTCLMPSIIVNFKNPKAPQLSSLKKLKVVCGCSHSSYDEELVLKEYLIYKMYNMLTDFSFGVRLAKITYKDVASKTKEYAQYGFLIEDVDDVAKRNGCREYEKPVLNAARTDAFQMGLVSMFQYMIGNTDWSLPNKHNIRFVQLRTDSISFPYVIPYDFDYCGLVNAPYAIPQPEFGIEKVTDRYYRGLARTKEEIDPVIQLFKEKKEFMLALVQNFTLLKKSVREQMVYYIETFYKDLDDKRKLTYVFEKAVDHY